MLSDSEAKYVALKWKGGNAFPGYLSLFASGTVLLDVLRGEIAADIRFWESENPRSPRAEKYISELRALLEYAEVSEGRGPVSGWACLTPVPPTATAAAP